MNCPACNQPVEDHWSLKLSEKEFDKWRLSNVVCARTQGEVLAPWVRGDFVKRTPLRPVSKNRQKVNRERKVVQEKEWGPHDEWRCWFSDRPASLIMAGACAGEVWGHEILKRSRAGSTDANLLDIENQVPLCNLHNVWVEDHPDKAHWLGLSKHSWEA